MNKFDDVLIIKPSAKPMKFYKVFTFDTESLRFGNGDITSPSYREYQVIFNHNIFDGKNHYYGLNILEFYDNVYKLVKSYKKITLVGHFIRYDLQILNIIKFILKKDFLGYSLQKVMIDNVIFVKFHSSDKNYVIQFIDSYNFFKASLQSLGEKIGLKKLDLEDYKLSWEDWNIKIRENGEQRVKIDCEVLYKVFMSYLV